MPLPKYSLIFKLVFYCKTYVLYDAAQQQDLGAGAACFVEGTTSALRCVDSRGALAFHHLPTAQQGHAGGGRLPEAVAAAYGGSKEVRAGGGRAPEAGAAALQADSLWAQGHACGGSVTRAVAASSQGRTTWAQEGHAGGGRMRKAVECSLASTLPPQGCQAQRSEQRTSSKDVGGGGCPTSGGRDAARDPESGAVGPFGSSNAPVGGVPASGWGPSGGGGAPASGGRGLLGCGKELGSSSRGAVPSARAAMLPAILQPILPALLPAEQIPGLGIETAPVPIALVPPLPQPRAGTQAGAVGRECFTAGGGGSPRGVKRGRSEDGGLATEREGHPPAKRQAEGSEMGGGGPTREAAQGAVRAVVVSCCLSSSHSGSRSRKMLFCNVHTNRLLLLPV